MSRSPFDRNKRRLSTAFLICCLVICSFVVSVKSSIQPPLDSTTYNVATIGQPSRLDPARAFDTTSGELIQNVYQTLISCSDKHPINFTPGIGYNLTVADYSDLTQYEPVLATEVPTVENGRLIVNSSGSYWRFTINTNAVFQPWTAANGSIMLSRNVTAADVVYSFRRQIIYDSRYSPSWMWMTPAFGYPSWRDVYGGPYPMYSNGTFLHGADEAAAGVLISNWSYAVGSDIYFNFTQPWAEGVLKQIFSQTWGSIVNPDWVKEMGGWDGLFTAGASDSDNRAGWSNNYHWKPTNTRSELDTYKSPVTFSGHGSRYATFAYAMCGTGPYKFTSWDIVSKIWRIDGFPAYWMGWADAGDKAGNYLSTVTWKSIDAWPTRKMLFLEGECDVAAVPLANMPDLLTTDAYTPVSGINLVYNIPVGSNDVEAFDLNISSWSSYQAYVGYPNHKTGGQPYFFNNTHMRRAFAWAFNYTAYIQDTLSGEGMIQRSWWIEGLSPQSYKNTNASMPQRNLNYTEMQNELNQAIVGGFNVSQEGFEVDLVYIEPDPFNGPSEWGKRQRIILQLMADAFQSLNPKYKCNVVVYYDIFLMERPDLPLGNFGWLWDFADPDNLCEPYQASWGAFMVSQGPPFPEDQAFVDTEIAAAMVEPNATKRGEMYMDLQYRYWLDVPSFPLYQPVTRRWARDWVQGWYFNALSPGEYAYDLYKSFAYPYPAVDVDATNTIAAGPGPTYGTALIFHGGMYLGFMDGTPHLLAPQGMNYTVSVKYTSGSVANLLVAVGLKRNSSQPVYGETQYPCVDQIILSPGQNYSNIFWWQEDGTTQAVSAGDSSGEDTGTIYSVGLEGYPVNGQDMNTSNNYAFAQYWNASRLVGDIKSDGIVDIYDALKLSAVFGRSSISSWWNADADLKPDLIIDVYDGILLSANFNKHVP